MLKSRPIRYAVALLAALLCVVPAGWSGATKLICALGPNASSYKSSGDQRPSPDAMQLAARVNAAVKAICAPNCPSVALFRNVTSANAMFVAEGDQPRLVYAPQFLASVHDSFGDAGVIAIIAHEFGHALDDGMGAAWIQSGWTPELRADAWGGCMLAKSNLSAAEMESALNALAKYPSPAHPAWTVRLPAIRTGYTQCGGGASKFKSK